MGGGVSKREHRRYTKRLETVFKTGGRSFRSFSSDISKRGLFIKTNRAFAPGSIIDIELGLPDGSVAYLKGRVRRATKTMVSSFKNGMGVELIEVDDNFKRFLMEELSEESGKEAGEGPRESSKCLNDDTIIMLCSSCKAKNRLEKARCNLGPKCGRCGAPLQP